MINAKPNYRPVALIALAALLWSFDSIVRYPAAANIDLKVLVLIENLIPFGLATVRVRRK